MGTLIGIIKDGNSCIAADCWNVREPLMKSSLNKGHGCILKIGDSYLGLNSTVAFQQMFEHILEKLPEVPLLNSSDDIHRFFTTIHAVMRTDAFMNVHYQQSQEFEWTPMNALIVNSSGVYKVDSARAVYQFNNFWAIGSGENVALGAFHATYSSNPHLKARDIATIVLNAVAEFDPASGRDFIFYEVLAKSSKVTELPTKQAKVKNVTRASKKGRRA